MIHRSQFNTFFVILLKLPLPLHHVSREEVKKNTSRDTQKHPLAKVRINPTTMAAIPPEWSRDLLLTPYQATRGGGSPRQMVHRSGEVEKLFPFCSISLPGSHRRRMKNARRDMRTHTPALVEGIGHS